MDSDAWKFHPKAIDETVADSVRKLAKSVQSVATQLLTDLADGADIVSGLAWAKQELDRLAEEAEVMSNEAHIREQQKEQS